MFLVMSQISRRAIAAQFFQFVCFFFVQQHNRFPPEHDYIQLVLRSFVSSWRDFYHIVTNYYSEPENV